MIGSTWVLIAGLCWIVISTVGIYFLSFVMDRYLLLMGWVFTAAVGIVYLLMAVVVDSFLSHLYFGKNVEAIFGSHALLMIVVSINFEGIQRVVKYPHRVR